MGKTFTKDFLRWDGMQRYLHPLQASFTEAMICVNYTPTHRFSKKRRTGYTKFLTVPNGQPIYAMVPVTMNDGTFYVLVFAGTTVYRFSPPSTTISAIGTLANDPGGIDSVFYRNNLFFTSTNGSNNLKYTNGTIITTEVVTGQLANGPKYIRSWGDRIFVINDNSAQWRLRGSWVSYGGSSGVPFDGNQWVNDTNFPQSTAFTLDLAPDVDGSATALEVVNNRLIVFKSSADGKMGMHRWDGDSEVPIPTTISIRPGQNKTIQLDDDGMCWFANDTGIYQYNGQKPFLASLALGELNNSFNPVAAVDFDKKYMVALGSPLTISDYTPEPRTYTNPIVVMDHRANEVYLYNTAHRMTAFAEIAQTSTSARQLWSADASGNIYLWDGSNTDNGTPIQGEIESRLFFGDSYSNDMSIEKLWGYGIGEQELHFRTDLGGWDREYQFNGIGIDMPLPTNAGRCKGLGFLVTCSTSGESPEFLGLSAKYTEEIPV